MLGYGGLVFPNPTQVGERAPILFCLFLAFNADALSDSITLWLLQKALSAVQNGFAMSMRVEVVVVEAASSAFVGSLTSCILILLSVCFCDYSAQYVPACSSSSFVSSSSSCKERPCCFIGVTTGELGGVPFSLP